MDMNQINETVAELARLQKEYEAALDRGDQRQADRAFYHSHDRAMHRRQNGIL